MKKSKFYEVMIFSGDHEACRQYRIPKTWIRMVLGTSTFILAGSIFLLSLFIRDGLVVNQLEVARLENKNLVAENKTYQEAAVEFENKLQLFEVKSTRLAQLVGEDGYQDEMGLGGPELVDSNSLPSSNLFNNELNSYMRSDLALLHRKAMLVEERLSAAESAYKTRQELLDSVPSLLPANGWFASGFSYRTDPFTGKKRFHKGLDISCDHGTPVYAPANGVITRRGRNGGFGKSISINHGNGIVTRYAHLSKFNVSKGQRVKKGDLIGYVGSTGRSTGPHLHYEVHKNGKAVNPMKYIIKGMRLY
jgi:murein DD-endopeptidase MepM/ murein hydrolase activator NlpD